MDIIYFTNEQKAYLLPFFKGYDFPNGIWRFIETPTGWILPVKILKDKETVERVPNWEEFLKEIVIRPYSQSDKMPPKV